MCQEKNMENNLSSRLLEVRKQNKLSQEALAKELGVSRQTISKWENGEKSPDAEQLIALSKIYGISLDELVGGEEKKDKKAELLYPEMNKVLKILPMYVLVPIAYVALGLITNLWHPLWFMFFLIPIYFQVLHASFAKSKKSFLLRLPVVPVAIVTYLFLGFAFSLWKIGVIVILLILVYYWLIAVSDKITDKKL